MYFKEETKLKGVAVLTPKQFPDERGEFFEVYSQKALEDVGINFRAVQENHIINTSKGVIRGLHFQNDPHAQAKIVRCIRGTVTDVAVDMRKGSPTYLEWVSVELSEENKKQLFLPRGFAHGVISRSVYSEIQYVVDNLYAPAEDRNIAYNDPDIAVEWYEEHPILSEKDLKAPTVRACDCSFIFEK